MEKIYPGPSSRREFRYARHHANPGEPRAGLSGSVPPAVAFRVVFSRCALRNRLLFVFSSRIHESRDYLEGRATVFHSRFLSAWASAGAEAKLSVVLGHFVLPPACLQEGRGRGNGPSGFGSPGGPTAHQSPGRGAGTGTASVLDALTVIFRSVAEIRRRIGHFIWERAEDSLAGEVKATGVAV